MLRVAFAVASSCLSLRVREPHTAERRVFTICLSDKCQHAVVSREKVSTLTVSWQTGETRTEKTWEVWLSEEQAESGQPEGCCGEGLTNDAEITDTNIQSVETLQSSGDTKQRESVMSYLLYVR